MSVNLEEVAVRFNEDPERVRQIYEEGKQLAIKYGISAVERYASIYLHRKLKTDHMFLYQTIEGICIGESKNKNKGVYFIDVILPNKRKAVFTSTAAVLGDGRIAKVRLRVRERSIEAVEEKTPANIQEVAAAITSAATNNALGNIKPAPNLKTLIDLANTTPENSFLTVVSKGIIIDIKPNDNGGYVVYLSDSSLEASDFVKVWLSDITFDANAGELLFVGNVRKIESDSGAKAIVFAKGYCPEFETEIQEAMAVEQLNASLGGGQNE